MNTAVIYARYSSASQGESSITGQIEVIRKFAQLNGYTVVGEPYIDRAMTGTNDNRPALQRMIRDSAKRNFETVLVYSLDRFARSREDSAHNKAKLKKNGVKVISATEPISTDPAGILTESLLEGMAEYYSAELSSKVRRGLKLEISGNKYIGGHVPLGYTISKEKDYLIDLKTAQIVHKCFELCASGHKLKEIAAIVQRDYGISFGNGFNKLNKIFSNKLYIGTYTRGGRNVPNAVPRIVSDELFEGVQQILGKNRKAPARARAVEEYLLTTKLFCGYCREMLVGVSGTGKSGVIHHYYTCKGVLHKQGCKKKNVKKGQIEDFIVGKARDVFCKYFLYKVASNFCILLQVQNVQSCKFLLQTLVAKMVTSNISAFIPRSS